jgi:ParB-like chromosome segregation protein Spo0J
MSKRAVDKAKTRKREGESPGMQVEMWPVDRPIDYPKNARKWSQKAIDTVATSLREFGFRQPLVVDPHGVIIIGHLRRAAARTAGFTVVPVHVADLPAAKVRALRLMDNRSHDEAQWDLDVLAEEIAGDRSL